VHRLKLVPRYKGIENAGIRLPTETQKWLDGKKRSLHLRRQGHRRAVDQLQLLVQKYPWVWPRKTVYFFSDLHADADAFRASLIASGGVKAKGKRHRHLQLTKQGRRSQFLIGGDCFDKGPSNLSLLKTLKILHDHGAHLRILAGNHDVRVMLGMRSVNRIGTPGCEHFFVRMGPKVVPLLKEISDNYLKGAHSLKDIPGEAHCEQRLFPPERWFDEFPEKVADLLPAAVVERELGRVTEKRKGFDELCDNYGLSVRRVYAATLCWQQLFLADEGEFSWFYRHMRLAMRKGSFLFVHAGLDNTVAQSINQRGVKGLNREFRAQLQGDPLRFYYGPVANVIRTKYRPGDRHLTKAGAKQVHETDVHVIIHGHKNGLTGQRISLRHSIVHFECDVTLDRHSRQREGLKGPGAGVTIVRPDKKIIGISTDHPYVKVFDPTDLLANGADYEA